MLRDGGLRSGDLAVLHVAEGRDSAVLAEYYRQLTPVQRQAIRAVALDMSLPYVKATCEHLPEGADKIVFDRFHIMKQVHQAAGPRSPAGACGC